VRILLVGAGRWGANHLRVLRELGATVWVADPAPARRAWALAEGIEPDRVLGDFRAGLGAVDAVDVVTPADSHAEIVEASLGAGRHCLVEKPLALTAAEGRRLAAAAAAAGRVLQVGHVLRFHPVTVTLRLALAEGSIGAVRFARSRFAGFKRPRTDVGITHTDAIHHFDLFAHLLGRPATGVMAVQRDFLGRGLDDFSVTLVDHGGIPVVVEADYFGPGVFRECVLVGERGSLVADYGAFTVTRYLGEHQRRSDGAWEAVETGKESLSVGREEPLRVELERFADACAGRGPCPVTAEDGVAALEIVEAAAHAAHLGRTVTLQEMRPPTADR
jgi:UDP-2-acetamido-3-amino-2,3-dideoxy-glucuronate N-acetyltransferase